MNSTSTFIGRVQTQSFATHALITQSQEAPWLTLSIVAGVILALTILHTLLAATYLSPFRQLERPSTSGFWSFIMGNLVEMQRDQPGVIQMQVSCSPASLSVESPGLYCGPSS